MKKCTKCKIEKELSEFNKDKKSKDGFSWTCRKCSNISKTIYRKKNKEKLRLKQIEYMKNNPMQDINYNHSEIGVLHNLYNAISKRAREKFLNEVDFTFDEFKIWCYKNNFEGLHNDWVNSNYNRNLKPSIDILDDYNSYKLKYIQLITWRENNLKYHKCAINGINQKQNKAVVQIELQNFMPIAFYHSLHEADKQTGISFKNISSVCNNKRKDA